VGERLDRALALAERFVAAVERIAEATQPVAKPAAKPPRPATRSKPTKAPRARELAHPVEAFDPGQRDDRLVLYIGQAVDVISRLQRHPRMPDVYQRWGRIPDDVCAQVEPFVLAYEGEPDHVERALAAVHGMPPWNVKTIHPRPDRLQIAEEIVGAAAVLQIPYRRSGGMCGGYAIGIQGPRDAATAALQAMMGGALV